MTARTTLRRRLVVPGLGLGAPAAGPLLHAGESDDESGTDRAGGRRYSSRSRMTRLAETDATSVTFSRARVRPTNKRRRTSSVHASKSISVMTTRSVA